MRISTYTFHGDKIVVLCDNEALQTMPQNFEKGTHYNTFTALVYENKPETLVLLRLIGVVGTTIFSERATQFLINGYGGSNKSN